MYMGEITVYITCAMALAVFDISKPVDVNGTPIEPAVEYLNGTVR